MDRPQCLNQFAGNKAAIIAAKNYIESQPFAFIIVGPSGCGKTSLVEILLKNRNFDIMWINSNEVDDSKTMQKVVYNFMNYRNIESFLSIKKKVIIFDDVDAMMCSDRGSGTFLNTFVGDNKKRPEPVSFIMTCSTSEERKLTDIKKKVPVLRLYNPTAKEAFVYVCNVLDARSQTYDHGRVMNLVAANNSNIRGVLTNLDFNNNAIDVFSRDASEQMFFDQSPFEMTKKMLTTKFTIESLRYAADNPLVPLLLYENFPSELFENRLKQAKHIVCRIVEQIIDGTIESEIIEKHMYANTDWDLLQPVSILKCGYMNTYVNSVPKKKSQRKDNLVFTQSLTKAASRHNYGKRIKDYKAEFGIRDATGIFKAFETNEESDLDTVVASYLSNVRQLESKPVRRASTKKKKTQSDS